MYDTLTTGCSPAVVARDSQHCNQQQCLARGTFATCNIVYNIVSSYIVALSQVIIVQ